MVQQLFASFANRAAAAETVRGVLEKYLSFERPFAQSIQPFGGQEREKMLLL